MRTVSFAVGAIAALVVTAVVAKAYRTRRLAALMAPVPAPEPEPAEV